MKMYVMVRDHEGNRFNPRVGGYDKAKCVYALTKKFPVVEVRTTPYGETEYGFFRGMRMGVDALRIRVNHMLYKVTYGDI